MIIIKSDEEIELIKKSCEIIVEAFEIAQSIIKPGIATKDIDKEIESLILSRNAIPAFKGFNGFPASTCISVEDQVVHGIPGSRRLKEGEIVSVDIGVKYKGYYGDAARTFAVGEISEGKQRLLEVTRQALLNGIEQARQNNRISDISHAVQSTVEEAGYSVVRDLVGHGVGRRLHEPPQIPNYGVPNQGPRIKRGMVLAIEPMVNMGGFEVELERDKWTVHTKDRKPSAHFEHSVAITDNDPIILSG